MSKQKITKEEFGKMLVPGYQKYIITPLVKKYLRVVEKNDKYWKKDWQFDLNSKTDKETILKEWIIFEMFLFGQEILAYFKGNETGKNIVRNFHRFCIDSLTEYNIFTADDNIEDLLSKRYSYYLKTLEESKPNNILLLSKNIINQLCRDEGNILHITAIAKYYFEASTMYRKLINDLMKEVILID
jgi:hypothetical protein